MRRSTLHVSTISLIGEIAEREVTSKTEASGPTHAITRHPPLPLDGGWSGKCESFTMPCNAERGLWGLPDCITVPICLGGVFHVTSGVTELWRVTPHQEQRYLPEPMCRRLETISNFYGLGSQILECHILLACIKARTRSGQTTCWAPVAV